MNILDFINNQSFEDNQEDSSSMTPLEAFHKECDELESLCPNLDIVRNHIKAFRFVYDENGSNVGVQPMLPDCEINYDLGYVYDPQFRSKYWIVKFGHYKKGDVLSPGTKYDPKLYPRMGEKFRRIDFGSVHRPNEYRTNKQQFLLECRGYCERPWKFEEVASKPLPPPLKDGTFEHTPIYIDEYGKEHDKWAKYGLVEFKVPYIEDFALFIECCKTSNWKAYIQQHAGEIQNSVKRVMKYKTKNYDNYKLDPEFDKKLTEYMKSYFQVQVLNQLVYILLKRDWANYHEPIYPVYTYEKDYIVINNTGAEEFPRMTTIKLPIYRIVNKRWLSQVELYEEADGKDQYKAFYQVWDPKLRPEMGIRVKEELATSFVERFYWLDFVKKKINARSAFEHYVKVTRTVTFDSKKGKYE